MSKRHLTIPTGIIVSHLLLGMLLWVLAGCDTPQEQTSPVESLAVVNRPLATVFISPTANAEQVRATSLASSPTPTPATPSPTPRPTEYIGIFIGEAEPLQGAMIDPDVFASISTPLPPTVVPANCSTPIDIAYVSFWQSNDSISQAMGCPIQLAIGFEGEVQVFENGVMYQHSDTSELWAILPDNPTGDYVYAETPPDVSTAEIISRAGIVVPTGGFARLWVSQANLQADIGSAQTPAIEINMGYQRFTGGTFLIDNSSGQIFALLADGTVYGPYLAGFELDTVPQSTQPAGEESEDSQ